MILAACDCSLNESKSSKACGCPRYKGLFGFLASDVQVASSRTVRNPVAQKSVDLRVAIPDNTPSRQAPRRRNPTGWVTSEKK